MITNQRIVNRIGQVQRGEVRLKYAETPGYCLSIVRQILESALGIDLYKDYVTSWVAPPNYNRALGHWARDFERDAKLLGWPIRAARRQPGDIIFNHNAAPWFEDRSVFIGHIGILHDHDMIFENIDPRHRKRSMFKQGTALALTPYGDWPVTLVARLPESIIERSRINK